MKGRIISHYEVEQEIARGGMGVVYRARDLSLNRFVALKALPVFTSSDPVARLRFEREAQAASALNHPNIVTIYDLVSDEHASYIVMEFIEGKTLGVAEGDLSIRLWPALARQNGIKVASVKQEHFGAAVREPMLSAGQVDAVSGFSYLSAVNLRDRGVPADDLAVFRYADYGCEAYGFAVIVNPAFAAARPEAVKGFLRAVVAGAHLAIQQPKRAVDEVVGRMDGGSPELELERLRTVIHDNILTGEVQRDGIGGIDPARMERSIDQISEGFKFRKRPSATDIFDESFLPPLGGRLIN